MHYSIFWTSRGGWAVQGDINPKSSNVSLHHPVISATLSMMFFIYILFFSKYRLDWILFKIIWVNASIIAMAREELVQIISLFYSSDFSESSFILLAILFQQKFYWTLVWLNSSSKVYLTLYWKILCHRKSSKHSESLHQWKLKT